MSTTGSLAQLKRKDIIKFGRAGSSGGSWGLALGGTAGGGGNFVNMSNVGFIAPYDFDIEIITFNNFYGGQNNWAMQFFVNQTATITYTNSFFSNRGVQDKAPGTYLFTKGDEVAVKFINNHATASLADVLITLYIKEI